MKNITKSCMSQQFPGALLNWSNLTLKAFSVIGEDIEKIAIETELCEHSSNQIHKLIANQETAHTALLQCQALGGSMFFPQAKHDIPDVIESEHNKTRPASDICSGYTWLPFYKQDVGELSHLDESLNISVKPSYDLFNIIDNGKLLQRCYRHNLGGFKGADTECESSLCFICSWDKLPAFSLKGLSPGSKIETNYLLLEGYHNGVLWFGGFNRKHFIIYEKEQLAWLIVDNYNSYEGTYGKVLGTFKHPMQAIGLPIGLQVWKMAEQNGHIQLKLTSCGKREFTCNDGSCINISFRCNDFLDCSDSSDENNCASIVINPQRYKKDFPPMRHNSSTDVKVSIYLLSINKIDELDMKFTPKIKIQLRWTDFRLDYMNLRPGISNPVEKKLQSEVWTPSVYFSNHDNNAKIENDAQAIIEIEAFGPESLNDPILDVHEAVLFRGSENRLSLTKEFEVDLRCPFDLRNYPFDTQVCSIQLEVASIQKNYVRLIPDIAKNIANTALPQFNIIGMNFTSNESTPYLLECRVRLNRIPFSHLATTYAPTLCILLMALITLFIDESHFEATIMVSLTAMLVMYTLFQSISIKMPTTAYLKLLDFWLIFGLVMPFFIFIVEVSWELGKGRSAKVEPSQESKKAKQAFKQMTKILIPAFTVGFLIAYIFVVWSIYE